MGKATKKQQTKQVPEQMDPKELEKMQKDAEKRRVACIKAVQKALEKYNCGLQVVVAPYAPKQ